MPTTPVTDITFPAAVLRSSGAVLVEFWKTGCAPCTAFKPILERFAAERPDVAVMTYEVVLGSMDHRRWKRYHVMATPTVVLFQDGEPIWQAAGVRPAAQLNAEIDAALSGPSQQGVA